MTWWITGYFLAVSALLVFAGYSAQARSGDRWVLAPYSALAGSGIGAWIGLTFWGRLDFSVLALGVCFPLGAALRQGGPQSGPRVPPRAWGEDVASGFLFAGVLTLLAIAWGSGMRVILLLLVTALGLIRILLDPVRESKSAPTSAGPESAAQVGRSR